VDTRKQVYIALKLVLSEADAHTLPFPTDRYLVKSLLRKKETTMETDLRRFILGKPSKRSDYGIRAEKKAQEYLKKRFKVVSSGRKLTRSPASHGPADWEVIADSGKIVALIQVKASRTKGGARLSSAEHERLIETAKQYNTRAFLTKYERGHYSTIQVYPATKKTTRKTKAKTKRISRKN